MCNFTLVSSLGVIDSEVFYFRPACVCVCVCACACVCGVYMCVCVCVVCVCVCAGVHVCVWCICVCVCVCGRRVCVGADADPTVFYQCLRDHFLMQGTM